MKICMRSCTTFSLIKDLLRADICQANKNTGLILTDAQIIFLTQHKDHSKSTILIIKSALTFETTNLKLMIYFICTTQTHMQT